MEEGLEEWEILFLTTLNLLNLLDLSIPAGAAKAPNKQTCFFKLPMPIRCDKMLE